MAQKLDVVDELFVIPHDKNYVLYAPLQGSVLEVNAGTIKLLKDIQLGKIPSNNEEIVNQLKEYKILTTTSDKPEETKESKEPKEFVYYPTSAILMPTLDCNLTCVYCYARSGEDIRRDMSFDTAQAAIDFIIENAQKLGRKQVQLGFHGGGEPFFPRTFGLVRRSVDYARSNAGKKDLEIYFDGVTNGVMSKSQLEWIIHNFNSLSVSFDGPKDIQDKQRPLKNGKPSFENVLATVQTLEESKFHFRVRSTITEYNVARMPELVEFFHYLCPSLKAFHFESLFECGRCKKTQWIAPKPEDFLHHSIEARKTAKKFGVHIVHSASEIDKVSPYFCGASAPSFYITPEGAVTACPEISRRGDPQSDIFLIGEFDQNKKQFIFYQDKIKSLRKRRVENIPYCTNCFARLNCSGYCPNKVYTQSGSMFDTSKNKRCEAIKGIIQHQLIEKLEGNKL